MQIQTKALKRHKANWCKCTKCTIGCTAIHHILYEGSIPAHYLFIGEAPGHTEDQVGKPFIGSAGKVLRAMLKDVGLSRADYCISNVLACFPSREDDVTSFRKPTKTEVESCYPRLIELINLVEPKLIILLGEEAKKAYKIWISKELDDHTDFNILELRHPSFILRNGGVGSVEYKRNLLKLKEVVDEQLAKKKVTSKR